MRNCLVDLIEIKLNVAISLHKAISNNGQTRFFRFSDTTDISDKNCLTQSGFFLFPIRDRRERIQTVLMAVIQWGNQKRIVMEAPGITQEETTGFDF